MAQVKLFEAPSITFLEKKVNEFLERLDDFKDIKFSTTIETSENASTKHNYIAVVVFTPKSGMTYE
jgi:Sporulation protein Cse60